MFFNLYPRLKSKSRALMLDHTGHEFPLRLKLGLCLSLYVASVMSLVALGIQQFESARVLYNGKSLCPGRVYNNSTEEVVLCFRVSGLWPVLTRLIAGDG